jgi:hypothetical protein
MREEGYTEKQIKTQAEVIIAYMEHIAWMDATRREWAEQKERHNRQMRRFGRVAQYAFFGVGCTGTIAALVLGLVYEKLMLLLGLMAVYWIAIVAAEFCFADDIERFGGKRWPWQ